MRPQVGFSSLVKVRLHLNNTGVDTLNKLFDAADHPGNADSYPDRDRNKERYDHEYGTEDREKPGGLSTGCP